MSGENVVVGFIAVGIRVVIAPVSPSVGIGASGQSVAKVVTQVIPRQSALKSPPITSLALAGKLDRINALRLLASVARLPELA